MLKSFPDQRRVRAAPYARMRWNRTQRGHGKRPSTRTAHRGFEFGKMYGYDSDTTHRASLISSASAPSRPCRLRCHRFPAMDNFNYPVVRTMIIK